MLYLMDASIGFEKGAGVSMDCCKTENVQMISGVPVCRICLKGIGQVMAKAVKVHRSNPR